MKVLGRETGTIFNVQITTLRRSSSMSGAVPPLACAQYLAQLWVGFAMRPLVGFFNALETSAFTPVTCAILCTSKRGYGAASGEPFREVGGASCGRVTLPLFMKHENNLRERRLPVFLKTKWRAIPTTSVSCFLEVFAASKGRAETNLHLRITLKFFW